MKKGKVFIVIGIIAVVLVLVFSLLLIPIPRRLKDGGTVEYNAVLYSVDKVNSIGFYGGNYVGTRVRVLFWTVYDDVEPDENEKAGEEKFIEEQQE